MRSEIPREEIVRLRHDRNDRQGSPLERQLRKEIDGEVRFDPPSRALYAADASNYRHVPIGVVIPRTMDALIAAVAICREHDAPVLPRGGGTSLAGQTCNEAVVIDCSRHLTKVEIDDAGFAYVQPGTIMKSLRDAANARGWDFGPDPSTHDRCTLGGMLGNNSCGVHSVMSEFYGPGPRTSDHVDELDVLTYRGDRIIATATDDIVLRRIRDRGGEVAEIYGRLLHLRDRYADQIRARFPHMPRVVSGYDLPELMPDRGFHVGRALVGSEATCVTILGAKLRLMRAIPARVTAVLGYPDIYRAAAMAPAARERRPVGCEALDDTLVEKIKKQHRDRDHAIHLLPPGYAWLLVEHGAQTVAEARAQAAKTARSLDPHHAIVLDDPRQQQMLRDLREQALGVDAFTPGKPDTYEGWEDSSVAPERLEAYLRDLYRLYDEYGLHGSLYGHFGQGCVHTRIDFDLRHPSGIEHYRAFTEAAAHLVVSHGGSLSGEHGDGQSRAELLEIMFGKELVTAFGEFKTAWDPDRKMNPGKVVFPESRTSHLRLADYHPVPQEITLCLGDDQKNFAHAAVRCVGIGKCRKLDTGTMCPSYMITRDERHSTRGRAHLLFEMMRGELLDDGWQSEAVHESLDLCLACKACKRECPTHVDMASYKAEFLSHHYAHHRRPLRHYAFGFLHTWLGLGRPIAPLANWLANTALAKRIVGIAPEREVPRLVRKTFRKTFRPIGRGPRVLLWPDTFNDAFHPEVLHAAARLLAQAGYRVEIPKQRLCCGRPLFEVGFLERARAAQDRILDAIDPDVAIVGLEPTCVAALRDELIALHPGDKRAASLAERTHTLGELLADWRPADGPRRHVLYHRHCHQHAVLDANRDIALLSTRHDVEVLDSGCCGLAGPFGFERDHFDISVALAERVLLPAVRANPDAIVVSDGFSCREQLRQLAGIHALHSAQLLVADPSEEP